VLTEQIVRKSSLQKFGRTDTRIPRVLAFHAEKLHDDLVWNWVKPIARWMSVRDIRATFFVYAFRAQIANRDITDRVQTLASLGHEIGQHTHFYAGTKVDKPEKVNDLSEANIVHCLYRDFQRLAEMGFTPNGFTAGAWLVDRTVLDTLVKLGFSYDCSAQFPKPRHMTVSSYHRRLRSPELYANAQGELLCLPTTCSLGEWFKWGRKIRIDGKVPYQLIYLHDYDLLSFRNRLLVSWFLRISNRETLKPLASIAQDYFFKRGEVRCP